MTDPRVLTGPGLGGRLLEIDRRLAALEAVQGGGLLGTDQTIKGSHDRLDNLMASWRVSTTTDEFCTAQVYTDLVNSDQDIAVLEGDVVLAWWVAAWREDTARSLSAAFKLLIGATGSQVFGQASAGVNYVQNVSLAMRAVITTAATITVKAQCYVYTAGDNVGILDQEMIILRIRAVTV